MGEIKKKRTVRRAGKKAANSPAPYDPACGHGGCGPSCHVRYVGPTSHMRDHHALHAARGASHFWMAAIVTGFALVLTGAIALTAAQVRAEQKTGIVQLRLKQDLGLEIRGLNNKVASLQAAVASLSGKCTAPAAESPDE